jgi:hypothetical protein
MPFAVEIIAFFTNQTIKSLWNIMTNMQITRRRFSFCHGVSVGIMPFAAEIIAFCFDFFQAIPFYPLSTVAVGSQ